MGKCMNEERACGGGIFGFMVSNTLFISMKIKLL